MALILTDAEVASLLRMSDAIVWMRSAFRDLVDGTARVPVRGFVEVPEVDGGFLTMPVFRSSDGLLGVKLITLNGRNPARGLPRSRATVVVIDADDGSVKGILAGDSLTATRTGAGSGLATDLLARADSSVVAVFGAGRQAETQLEAVCEVRDIKRAMVFSRTTDSARRFATRMSDRLSIPIVADPPRHRITEADIICTATTSTSPVFADAELGIGVHINGVGSYKPSMAEVPAETVARSVVVVDQRAACLAEAGDLTQAIASGKFAADRIHAELGELVTGARSRRTVAGAITFFKSVGNAIQDLAVAAPLLELARARGVGTEVDLG
jgi:ornithine cyclodeaminase/alanine dehydrogenase-like protein (mu-crystallin family)